ncbi:hypothetical protein NQ315_015422 [Exocentrus adspersus]|uniref:Transmembrane protein n=1 Tax=Exocentrus adspersus TaxID=1586481 RepID=A0AAV8VLV9_9CUCU|nr:hypothetical protein NQ315_015422 [Exocentrus adspersus]
MSEDNKVAMEESRRKPSGTSLMQRILPALATPFVMQVTILPLVLMAMKFTLLNSMFLGKLGVLLWIIHLIRKREHDGGGLYSHNINIDHNSHPGHSYYDKIYV